MASVMQVTGTASTAPSASRSKPKLSLRGQQRKMVKKLLHYAVIIVDRDTKEQIRADEVGYVPLLFTVRPGNAVDKAIGQVIARCNNLLSAREG